MAKLFNAIPFIPFIQDGIAGPGERVEAELGHPPFGSLQMRETGKCEAVTVWQAARESGKGHEFWGQNT